MMKAASISALKKELAELERDELLDACARLARFKVENKELLTYLLMKSDDEAAYVEELCEEIDMQLPPRTMIRKKTMRKIIRWIDKCTRFSGNKETEVQVRIHFCQRIATERITWGRCRVSGNMYANQLKKIDKLLEKMHPDLQFDFRQQMDGWSDSV